MSIVAIDPATLRTQSKFKSQSVLPEVGFEDTLNALNPAVTTAVGVEKGYQPAAVANAAITGVAAAPGALAGNAPYYTAATQGGWAPPAGGYDYSNIPTGTYPTGSYPGYGTAGTNGLPGSGGFDNIARQEMLYQKINDSNWEMLVTQVTVNELSRNWQALSNIFKTKSDTEINAVRNLRA